MNETQWTMSKWADETFGPADVASLVERAAEELQELYLAVNDGEDYKAICEEVADVIIVLQRIPYMYGVDIQTSINEKMAINRNRKWKLRGNGHGDHI